MVVASLVETKRINVAKNHGLVNNPKSIVPMTIWWLVPQYVLAGIGEVFTIIGLQELFYDQMPEGMRSLGAAAFISIVGVGSFINNAIISIVQKITSRNENIWLGNNLNHAHLNYFYWVLAGLSVINFCVYLRVASSGACDLIRCKAKDLIRASHVANPLERRSAFGNADTSGAWLLSARACKTAGDKREEGEDNAKSSCPLCPGRHSCYNGGDKGLRSC
ncbi:hypothetical protein CRYUN_Cryun41cG0067500 [Craigia yunnanensis]